ncbi:MAG: COX15/CtaA family protein [Candidatus Omnitrophica bacterium]|nr:COX15/CtaA family protein [Candidatus Omnitrophota bacterium]
MRSLHLYSRLVAAATFVLIIAGGLVTSTGSGLSVPDWPLSYGKFFPPMIGGIRFEHTHRVIAAGVGLLTLFLLFYLLRAEKRSWVKWLGGLAVAAVLVQAILGALTVKYLLPMPISVLHACLAQSFFSLIAAIALFTSPEWLTTERISVEDAPKLKRLAVLTVGFIFIQLILGALVRHSGNMKAVSAHIVVGFLVVLHALLLNGRISQADGIREKLTGHSLFLGSLALAQIFMGLGSFIYTHRLEPSEVPRLAEVLFTTGHQSTGALILVTCVLLTLRLFRLTAHD